MEPTQGSFMNEISPGSLCFGAVGRRARAGFPPIADFMQCELPPRVVTTPGSSRVALADFASFRLKVSRAVMR